MNHNLSTQELVYAVSSTDFVAPKFPQFEFSRLLAEGAMGASYKAVQMKLDRNVAIKLIARRIGRIQQFADAFAVQAKAAARLNHHNLVKVYDFGEVDEMLYMVNEYVSGTSLDVATNGCAIDPGQVLHIMMGLAAGIEHAHENGIVHGNLQPSTIMVNADIEPKISDFGLAMFLRSQGDMTTVRLNQHYTAPEVLMGATHGDELTDVYALGSIMYHLLTADSYSVNAVCPSSVSTCDHRYDAIVSRALAGERALRYQSASQMLADLMQIDTENREAAERAATIQPFARHQTVRAVQSGLEQQTKVETSTVRLETAPEYDLSQVNNAKVS